MLKPFIRSFVFVYITFTFVQYVVHPFDFNASVKVFVLIVLAISILSRYLASLLSMLSLPSEGGIYLITYFLSALVILNMLAVFIPQFVILPVNTPNLIILGFVIPSRNLPAVWSGALGALVVTLVYNFFEWLTTKK